MLPPGHEQVSLVGVTQLGRVAAVGGGVAAGLQLCASRERLADGGVIADDQEGVTRGSAFRPQQLVKLAEATSLER